MSDAEIWEEWAFLLDRLCDELSDTRREAGAQRRQFDKRANIDIHDLTKLIEGARTALAITEQMQGLHDKIE